MDTPIEQLPAVIVRFDHPGRPFHWWLSSDGITPNRNRATRYATTSAACRALRQAQYDLQLSAWTGSLEPA